MAIWSLSIVVVIHRCQCKKLLLNSITITRLTHLVFAWHWAQQMSGRFSWCQARTIYLAQWSTHKYVILRQLKKFISLTSSKPPWQLGLKSSKPNWICYIGSTKIIQTHYLSILHLRWYLPNMVVLFRGQIGVYWTPFLKCWCKSPAPFHDRSYS